MKRLELLDYARLLAALAVVAFHYLFQGMQSGHVTSISTMPWAVAWSKYGYLGVDLFLIISGYVIFFSARGRSAGEFAAARAVRLYPAFWVAMLFTASVVALWGAPQFTVTGRQVLLNLTMVPSLLGVPAVDGVYWTLALEASFYAVVTLVLLVGLQRYMDAILLAWPLVMLVAWLAGKGNAPFLGGYYTYFAAGSLFALMRIRATLMALACTAIMLFLCIDGAVARAARLADVHGVPYDLEVVGLLVASMFAFFFLLNTRHGQTLRLPGSRLAGALTYPLYLLHATFGWILLNRFATEQNKLLAYPIVLVIVLGVSYAVHALVEKRMAGLWRRLFDHGVRRPLDAFSSWRRPLTTTLGETR